MRFKDLEIFCKNHDLDPGKPTSWEFFRRDEKGLPWGDDDIHTECPECGKHRAKITRMEATAKWFCFYCGKGGTISGKGGVGLTPEQERAEKELREDKRAADSERALKIWDQCVSIGSNATVATYLGARRLELPPDPDRVMRWHGACPFGPGVKAPCIVSLFRCAKTDKATAVHRTRIVSASTGKSERMALGPMAGSAIKLWPLQKKQETLAVGEGIESVLAAVELGVADPPAWAATVANNLSRLPVIGGVKRLTILADNDEKKAGQQHAQALRRRWFDAGREVAAKMPRAVGSDFNDVLRGRS